MEGGLMNQSEHINELATALAKCQSEIQPALKDSNNPFFKSKYADLNAVWTVCREPLSRHGLCVIQTIDKGTEGEPILITTLAHVSGQWIKSCAPIPIKEEIGKIDPNKKAYKNDPQALGSSITYMRRYCLSAIVGISTEDDDGEAAMNRHAKEDKTKKAPPADDSPVIDYDKRKVLHNLANDCDTSYLATLYSYIESQGVKGFENITEKLYPRILRGMTQNAQANRDKNV
jgi:hypothetical protein